MTGTTSMPDRSSPERSSGHPAAFFPPIHATLDLPALERTVLATWNERNIFERTVAQRAGAPAWIFYEGPPTANGTPGTHHVEARAFKDLFCRYRTMKGYYVERRAGWDCHGLPVELAVEKELGFTRKQDIEEYGIAPFNERCRESVLRHVGEFERMSERMGYWLDYANAYRTMDPQYIESVWWSLRTLWDKGLLTEDFRVSPYCPRCQTALSDHEVAQGYTDVVDPSVYVRFPVTDGPLAELKAALLVWTTTPWTLVSNTAVAVHPGVTYQAVRVGTEVLVVAEPLVNSLFETDPEVLASFTGQQLEHTRYARPFELVDLDGPAGFVVLADYVTTEDGTGLVHQAPAFGAEDMAVARQYGLAVVNPLRADGHFDEEIPLVGGEFFKAADKPLVADLRARGLLWRYLPYTHSYPLCWRCDTALLYYALPSWYVRTTAIKDRLLAENAATDWHPATIRDGRYGDWLNNNIDWAVSRNRYWGTPLPIWRCVDGHTEVMASLAELGQRSGQELSSLDPHRPFVDDITFPCATCAATMTRVSEVIDCWYDAGSMPFAQWGAPHRNPDKLTDSYPADYITEAIDQTRGWFYTLMAIGTAVFDRSSYRTVLCLGHIVDENGRKMSKHLGNVLDPLELFDQHGADAVRWLMLAVGNPWSVRRVGHAALDEVIRKLLLTYWNTVSFLVLYANAAGWSPSQAPTGQTQDVLDQWLRLRVADTVAEVDAALDRFDTVRAGRQLTTLVDDLSNWYVRRSRRRFWAGDPQALAALHDALVTLSGLMAPFVPFLAEWVWQVLAVPTGAPESVHLSDFPTAEPLSSSERALLEQMALARRVVELGRAARAGQAVKTRQPLSRAMLPAGLLAKLSPELRSQVAAELNVGSLQELDGELVEVAVKPNFRALGKRFGGRTPEVAGQVQASSYDPASGTITVRLDDQEQVLTTEELIVTETPRTGWAVATDAVASVALDLTMTPALVAAGLVREVVRRIQEGRKNAGLNVTDRIELWWQAGSAELTAAVSGQAALVADEVLAISCTPERPAANLAEHREDDLDFTFWLRVAGG